MLILAMIDSCNVQCLKCLKSGVFESAMLDMISNVNHVNSNVQTSTIINQVALNKSSLLLNIQHYNYLQH